MSTPQTTEPERRRFHRHPCGANTWALLTAGLPSRGDVGRVLDLSRGGLRLNLRHRLRPGEFASVDVFHATGRFDSLVPLQVVHVHEQLDGTFFLGGAFTRNLTDQEIRQLLQGVGPLLGVDRR